MMSASWSTLPAYQECTDETFGRISQAARWNIAQQTFGKFCKEGQDMDGKSFAKLCRDCHLLDKQCTTTDTDLIFAKVLSKGQRRINPDQFCTALRLVAEKKGLDTESVLAYLDQSEGPVIRSTKASAVRFHDDSSLYTGTHRYGGPDPGAKGEGSFLSQLRDGSQLKSGSSSAPVTSFLTGEHAAQPAGEVLDRRHGEVRSPKSPGLAGTPTNTQDSAWAAEAAQIDLTALEAAFRSYCHRSTQTGAEVCPKGRSDMDGKSFAKLCKDCRFEDEGLPAVEVDIIFAKVISSQRGQRRINFEQFQAALSFVAQKLEQPFDIVCSIVEDLRHPTLHQDCTQAEPVRLHDDITTYTGRHKRNGSTGSSAVIAMAEVDDGTPGELYHRDDESTSASTYSGSRQFSTKSSSEHGSSSVFSSRAASPQPWRPDRGRSSSPSALTLPLERSVNAVDARHKSVRTRLAVPANANNARRPPPTGEVTLVLADVQESERLWEACPKGMRQAMKLYSKLVRDVIATWDGCEMASDGDSFLVAFHDSLDAVGFCLELQLALVKEVQWPRELLSHPVAAESDDGCWRGLRVKMAVHSGEAALTRDEVTGQPAYSGPLVRITKAIEGAAHGGQILVSASCFSQVDGLLVKLDSPQVVDLGTHILSSKPSRDDSVVSKGTVEVHLMQLVPQELAFDYFCIAPSTCSGQRCPGLSTTNTGQKAAAHAQIPGRTFMPIKTVRPVQPGFHESPSGSKVTMCFAFTQGTKDLTSHAPELAVVVLRMLRNCVRAALAASQSGYECQEDDGAFMLAFAAVEDASRFAVDLQRKLSGLPWPQELRDHSPRFSSGLKVQVGIIEGNYTSRGPHTSTGRADYFGPIVNRAARIAAAAHPGQALIGDAEDVDCPDSGLWRSTGIKIQGSPQTRSPLQRFGDMSPCQDDAGNAAHCETSVRRLGAFALKGIDKPLALWELQIPKANGRTEVFPEPNTRGRVSA
mmetsp:Transcript_52828/g.123592  ORF Transcript_52828/g.123592 Transcript_52828/m.123592 type:complete len:978 (-) Transcript_52828:141-3074(-)